MRTREAAVRAAQATSFNTPGMCQLHTRTWFDAPSVGDVDQDGLPDAEDGWRAEPIKYRHPNDRKAPLGTPLSWIGGSADAGHRAISLGVPRGASECLIRSTDAGGRGRVATVPLSWVERNWGLHYVGWSESMSGLLIPRAALPPTRVTQMRRLGREAIAFNEKKGTERSKLRAARIRRALEELPKR